MSFSASPEAIFTETSSPIEERLSATLDALSVAHERQYLFHGRYHDLAIPEAQLLIECDGFDYHHTKEQIEKDTRRDHHALARGWIVMRFTGSLINSDDIGCALKIKHVRDLRIKTLNLAVSKSLCGEYAFPSEMTN
jgi:very-short-patch-repair endonuclease